MYHVCAAVRTQNKRITDIMATFAIMLVIGCVPTFRNDVPAGCSRKSVTKVIRHPSRSHPRTAVLLLDDGYVYEKTEKDILTVGELEDYTAGSSVVFCEGHGDRALIARDIVGESLEHFKRIR